MALTPIDESAEITQILEICEPFLWLDAMQVTGLFGHYRLDAIVKAPPSVGADTPAISVRSRLLDRAEQALEALAAAGWQPVQVPVRMDVSTTVRNFTQTLAGVMVEPSQHLVVSMRLSLTVGRAR